MSYSIADNSGNSSAYTIAIQSTPFSNNQVSAGAGGGATATFTSVATAVSGSGQGGGLYVYDQIGAITITADSSNFTSNTVTGGKGRAPAFNNGQGVASVHGGAIELIGSATAPGSFTLTNSQITTNTLTAARNGSATGGGIASNDYSLALSSSPVRGNTVTGTIAKGGGIAAISDDQSSPVSYSVTSSDVTSNKITQSAGTYSVKTSAGLLRSGVQGGGLYLTNGDVTISKSSIFGNSATGVGGVNGANGGFFTGPGGDGEQGATAIGGGVFYLNTLGTTLSFNFNTSSASSNKLTGGAGGKGGNAGSVGTAFVQGGLGGTGGDVMGGGLFLLTDFSSTTNSSITNSSFVGNILSAGIGGPGGNGAFGTGGDGGNAQGGGIYNNSLNGGLFSTLKITGSTVAANQVSGGAGGRAGAGTTPNGGPGGDGGKGGSGQGGGLYEGDDATLTAINSTFGGPSSNPSLPLLNSNILSGGLGGAGGDAGTPATVPSNNGGNGGDGGFVQGGGVYVNNGNNGAATFINTTIASNQATSSALGGSARLWGRRRRRDGRLRRQRPGARRRLLRQRRHQHPRQHHHRAQQRHHRTRCLRHLQQPGKQHHRQPPRHRGQWLCRQRSYQRQPRPTQSGTAPGQRRADPHRQPARQQFCPRRRQYPAGAQWRHHRSTRSRL